MRSSLPVLLAALVPGLALAQDARTRPVETIESVVAVVDERPLLRSDVRALQAVRGLDEDAARDAAIDERLMHVEAARLPQAEVSSEEEGRALELLLEKRPALQREVSEPDLRRLLRREMAILKYVEFRFRPQVRVSDADVRQAWEHGAGRPPGGARVRGRAGGAAGEARAPRARRADRGLGARAAPARRRALRASPPGTRPREAVGPRARAPGAHRPSGSRGADEGFDPRGQVREAE